MATQKRAHAEEDEEQGHDRGGGFAKLPEECVAQVLSYTTPRDSCRSALVSKAFLSAAGSDALWEGFLPSDCAEILSRAVHPVQYSSKKDLYFRLCHPILVDGGGKVTRLASVHIYRRRVLSFLLERSTGKKTYMISPAKMILAHGSNHQYWTWISLPESRFAKVPELLSVCWFDIYGSIDSRLLSRKTAYVAYIVFKLVPDAYGLDSPHQKGSVILGSCESANHVSLQPEEEEEEEESDEEAAEEGTEGRRMRSREDGWLEVELGEFYIDEGDEGDVEMRLRETEELQWKHGLILQGFEEWFTQSLDTTVIEVG
ncbi:hypothetical protein BHE74_00010973 [Ensete ventricosum]|nr:hypothetical protein BHE74_00010973 [Ensete ventricosum]